MEFVLQLQRTTNTRDAQSPRVFIVPFMYQVTPIGYVRGEVIIAGFILRGNASGGTTVTYITQVDLKVPGYRLCSLKSH